MRFVYQKRCFKKNIYNVDTLLLLQRERGQKEKRCIHNKVGRSVGLQVTPNVCNTLADFRKSRSI